MYDFDTAVVRLKGIKQNSSAFVKKIINDRVEIVGTNGKRITMSRYEAITMFKYFDNVEMIPDDEIEFSCSGDRHRLTVNVKSMLKPVTDENEKPQIELLITLTDRSDNPSVIINIDSDYLVSKIKQIAYTLEDEH